MTPRKELTGAMNLYVLRGDLDFHWLRPADNARWPWRGGVPVETPWEEPSLTLSAGESAEEFLPVDCLPMNTGCDGPILSSFARDVLEGLLSEAGEFWPVEVLGHRYWWFNCLATVDALDADGTDADWGVVEGDWGEFRWIATARRLAFRPAALAGAPSVFRVPEFPQGALFSDDRVEHAIARHRLTGFRLDPVWSSTEGGVLDPPGFGFGGVFEQPAIGQVARKRDGVRT